MRRALIGLAIATALAGCAVQQKLDAALASDGARQGFTMTCVGAGLALNVAAGVPVSPDAAAGIAAARKIVAEMCGAGAPATAAELEMRMGKIVIEDQYIRAVIAKALGS